MKTKQPTGIPEPDFQMRIVWRKGKFKRLVKRIKKVLGK